MKLGIILSIIYSEGAVFYCTGKTKEMKAVIFVFSGTGNTLAAARFVAEELINKGYQAEVRQITLPLCAPNTDGVDLIGVGYPIHAFNSPKIVTDFVRLLPCAHMPAFIFKTSGEPFGVNNASSYCLYSLLTQKGYDVKTDTHLLMPYNIMFRYQDALVKQMYLHTKRMCKLIALRIVTDERDNLKYNFFVRGLSGVFRIQRQGAKLNGKLIRTTDKCMACGKCVHNCPAHNITLTEHKVKFGSKCLMCMRCVTNCPTDAIRFGFLNGWKVNMPYDFDKIVADEKIYASYVNENTRGYFKHFLKYYHTTEATLQQHGIE